MYLRLMTLNRTFGICWNAPDEGAGGAASDAGGAAETGANVGQGDEDVTSAIGRSPAEEKADDAAKGETTEGGEGEGKSEPAPEDTVPEDGVYAYNLPEGITADPTVSDAMNPVFKEAGLTQKQVDLVVGKYAELIQKDQETRVGRVDETLNGWLDAAKKDPEIGGDKWDASVKQANAVLDRFGDEETDAALRQTGAGVHPAIIRLLARAGAAIADDKFVAGHRAEPEKRSFEDFYEKTTPAGKRT